jgi:hypothetical protein
MTQRERQTPDRGNGPLAVPPAPQVAFLDGRPGASSWESLFLASPPARRQELLSRARATGILYAHQLSDGETDAAPVCSLLATTLVNGRSHELPAGRLEAVVSEDSELDADQREAVARALSTPDICLIAGIPGSGKSRVVVEILSQAASRGERVLFLAPGPAALDYVLTALACRETLCPVRCLGTDESPERLSADIRSLLLDARVRHFREQTRPQAHAAVLAVRSRLEGLRREDATRERLSQIGSSRAKAVARLAALHAKQTALFEDVMALSRDVPCLSTPFGAGLAAAQRERDETLAGLDARESAVRAELEKIRAALNAVQTDGAKLHLMAQARIGFRFWSGAWWRARRQDNVQARLAQLQTQRTVIDVAAASRAGEAAAIATERAELEAKYRSSLATLVNEETARRSTYLDGDRTQARAEVARLTKELEDFAATLDPATFPSPVTFEDSADCRVERARRLAEAEEIVAAAERWAAAVEKALPDIATQLIATADIVAATTAAVSDDPLFAEQLPQFDLLVLEEAERITETEFQRASRRARRWVLVGETTSDRSLRGASKPQRPTALRPAFFHRLWENLHADPSRLPYSWHRLQDGRLCCQLRTLAADDRPHLETERVADRPDIELRIVTPARGTPELTEVVFPAEGADAAAKGYLLSELDVLPVQSLGRGLRWSEEPGRVILWMEQIDPASCEEIAVAPGVSEWIGPSRPHGAADSTPFLTYALAFDCAKGWSRERAEEWVASHTGLRDSGRSTYLGVPHRMRPALARFVAGLLGAGFGHDWRVAKSSASEGESPVEFISVPSLQDEAETRRRSEPDTRRSSSGTATAPRLRAIKGGAGLETELSDARRPDALPGDLRDTLPAKGLVNYLEARAVLHDLEALAVDADFRAEAERWQQAECGRHGRGPTIAVIALYSAQAELIRQLVARVPALSASPFAIEVGTPDQFQQRESLAALVSLTRSHQHRPVSFGDGPQALALACTRARARLLLFGDPGTLARRSQCVDLVDHLDPIAAAHEHALVSHLVACIQGHGDRAVLRLRQGPGS